MGNIALLIAQYLPLAINAVTDSLAGVSELQALLAKAQGEGRDVTDEELAALAVVRRVAADAEAKALEGGTP